MKQILIQIGAIMMLTCVGYGQGSWDQAIISYNNEKYGEASSLLQGIVDEGKESTELYYNLANAYYKNGDKGQAVLYYERALRISPNNSEIKENLDIINKQLDTKVNIIPEFFLAAYWKNFSKVCSSSFWSIFQFVGIILGILGCYLWVLKRDSGVKKKGFMLMILGIVVALLCFLAGWTKYNLETDRDFAIVMNADANLHQGPDNKSKSIQSLSEGVKVEILDEINTWQQVRLMDKEEGWVQSSWLEGI